MPVLTASFKQGLNMGWVDTSYDDLNGSLRGDYIDNYTVQFLQQQLKAEQKGQNRKSVVQLLERSIRRKQARPETKSKLFIKQ